MQPETRITKLQITYGHPIVHRTTRTVPRIVQAHEWGKYARTCGLSVPQRRIHSETLSQLIPVNLKKKSPKRMVHQERVYYTSEITENPDMLKPLTPYE